MQKRNIIKPVYLTLLLVILFASLDSAKAARFFSNQLRSRVSFDKDWRFKLYEWGAGEADGRQDPDYDDSSWRKLNLPHDWAIEGPFLADEPPSTGKLKYAGIGWYRKHFLISQADEGKRFFIDFDGAMSDTKVWLNGQYVGRWPYGYASFRLELTDYIRTGQENVIAVRLDNADISSRWYPGAGIYRHTWLVKTNPVHVAHWGTYVTTPEISDKEATVKVVTRIDNQSENNADLTVLQEISLTDEPGKVVSVTSSDPFMIGPGKSVEVNLSLPVTSPKLWDIESPALYRLKTSVLADKMVLDVYETTFGIRSIVFDSDKGFWLNGRRVQLNGVCLHHDLGPLGSAVHRRGIERQLEIMREMGCNAIRTSHNPPAPELLEFCDKIGFLLIDEAFDCWAAGKRKNDYGRFFKDWHEKDLVALVHRDRNHPCVIMWSSGNEIIEQGQGEKGRNISQSLTDIFHREDPTRPVTAGCNNHHTVNNGFGQTFDIYGFNYKPHMYAGFRELHPQQPAYSSESSSCVSSRGEYFFPVREKKDQGYYHFQVSSYDLYAPPWAMAPDKEFIAQDRNPYILGEFVWTGFDYLGEPTPYNNDKTNLLNFQTDAEKRKMQKLMDQMGDKTPSRSSYFGIVDLCGFKKDRFYIYQARWRPELPMAHILPHWNWPERIGKVTPVHVYTSGDQAELFLNGKSLGRRMKQKVFTQPAKSLAMDKEVQASSHEAQKGNKACKGNDGRMTTRWCASDSRAGQWWQVDLGVVQPIKSCVIYWEANSRQYQYQIKVSSDNKNWKTVAEADFDGNQSYSVLKFDSEGRYLRVDFTGLINTWASFYEFQVFDHDNPGILPLSADSKEYYRLRWDNVVYEPGVLKVVAYKDGREWATEEMSTTGQAAKLAIIPDRKVIEADGRDLSFITLEVQDEAEQVVPRSCPEIRFSIEGPGEIIATGNGNAIDHTSFQCQTRNAFNGLCLAVVRSVEGQTGRIRVKAESDGLVTAETFIASK